MARQKSGTNKSAAIREVYEQNPKTKVKEVMAALAAKGIQVTDSLVYIVKGKMKRKKRKQMRQKVATVTGNSDPLTTIKKVKALAFEVGGFGKLKALVEALTE